MRSRVFTTLLGFVLASLPQCVAQAVHPAEPPSQHITSTQTFIAGVITGADGAPLHDIRIEVHALATGDTVATCTSNARGNFEANGITPGEYKLVASHSGASLQQPVDVKGGGTRVAVQLAVYRATSRSATISVSELATPDKARRLMEKARAALGKNHVEQSQKLVEQALAVAPNYAKALTFRAMLRLALNQTESAAADLDRAVSVDPGFGYAYLVRGSLFNQMGRFDDALESLGRGIVYQPGTWQYSYEMSKAWLGKKNYERSLVELSRAQTLGMAQLGGTLHVVRGFALYGQQRFTEAQLELEAYLKAEPEGQLAGSARVALAEMQTALARRAAPITLPGVAVLLPAPGMK